MAIVNLPVLHSEQLWQNWLLQFDNKEKLRAYVTSLAEPLDDISATLNDMTYKRGVDTAVGAQLDGVGVIVGQPRYAEGAFVLPFFGYLGQPAVTGYDQARYRRLGESTEDINQSIGDTEYKTLIRWKIQANSSNGTIPDIIRALRAVFPQAVRIRVQEPGARKVHVIVVLNRQPNPIYQNNLLSFIPKLAGIKVTAEIQIQ